MDPSTAAAIAPILIPIFVTLCYIGLCWHKPFRKCFLCHGYGRRAHKKPGRLPKDCRWCRRTGLRLRLGRRAFNLIHRLYKDGTR